VVHGLTASIIINQSLACNIILDVFFASWLRQQLHL
jgi:hypothetical protein